MRLFIASLFLGVELFFIASYPLSYWCCIHLFSKQNLFLIYGRLKKEMAVSPSLERITFISLFQHSDTLDVMSVGEHINRNSRKYK